MCLLVHLLFLFSLFYSSFSDPVGLVGPPLATLNELLCQNNNITLTLSKNRINVPNTDIFVTTRLFNAQLPGPIVRMKAGATCTIILVNNLTSAPCEVHGNGLNCPDTTNLHTHGLHITSKDYGDNINVTVQPQESHTYIYKLQEQILMGTHWYHPHHHGSTTLQTVGGAFGPLLVDPADSYTLPSDLKSLYKKARVVALNEYDFRLDPGAYIGYIKSWAALSDNFPNQTIEADISIGISPPHFVGVNGQYQPYISVNQSEVFVLRFVWASGTRPLELSITSGNCVMMLLARDGVFHRLPYLELPFITLLQGDRSDIAFRCDVPGVVTFSATPQHANDHYFGFLDEERIWQDTVFQFNVLPKPGPAGNFPTSEATFPTYLQDLRNQTPVRKFSVDLAGAILLRKNQQVSISADMGVNGVMWQGWENPKWTQTLCVNTLYEIELRGSHPYHQHVNHYQIKATQAIPSVMRPGEFRDIAIGVFSAGPAANSTGTEFVLMKTWDYDGVYILHCHITEHEDSGLMGGYLVQVCNGTDDGSSMVSKAVEDSTSSTNVMEIPDNGFMVSTIVLGVVLLFSISVIVFLVVMLQRRKKVSSSSPEMFVSLINT